MYISQARVSKTRGKYETRWKDNYNNNSQTVKDIQIELIYLLLYIQGCSITITYLKCLPQVLSKIEVGGTLFI